MNEEPQITETPAIPPKKPRRQYRKRRVNARREPRQAPAAKPPATGEFAGLSPTECCDSCYDTGTCAISGDICVHPFKGGLQSAHQTKPDVVRKFSRAKRLLRNLKIELRE